MTMLLDIEDNKIPFMTKWIAGFPFAQVRSISEKKEFLLQEIKEPEDMGNLAKRKFVSKDPFADVFGMWADRDIDAVTLRKQAWGIED